MEGIYFLLFFAGYVFFCFFALKYISKKTAGINPFVRIIILSASYASLLGIGIAASGGDPGFGLPAPNIIAIVIMLGIKNYEGALVGLYFLIFWWFIIFIILLIKHFFSKNNNHNVKSGKS